MRRSSLLTFLIFGGLVLGVLYGIVLHDDLAAAKSTAGFWIRPLIAFLSWIQSALGIEPVARSGQFTFDWLRDLGTFILIRPLMLLIIPVVFLSVVLGVHSISTPVRLSLVGGAMLMYFLITMLLSSILGAALAYTLRPGDLPADQKQALIARAEADFQASDIALSIQKAKSEDRATVPGAWSNLIDQLIPTNIVREMSEARTLGVIVFALLLGLALAAGGSASEPAIKVLASLHEAIMRLITWLTWLAPTGVFLLMSWSVGKMGFGAFLAPIRNFTVVVVLGLALHGIVILPVVLLLLGRRNPLGFGWSCRRALFTAFGTASSSATLPVTLEVCEREAGCSKAATRAVVPLGTSLNMNGTAFFQAAAAVFLCQLYGIDLLMDQLVIVVITATLASIGTAGLPSVGLVTLVIVINAVNLNLAGKNTLPESAIGAIVVVDRLFDMCRTTVNVWSNMVAARIISRLAQDAAVDGRPSAIE